MLKAKKGIIKDEQKKNLPIFEKKTLDDNPSSKDLPSSEDTSDTSEVISRLNTSSEKSYPFLPSENLIFSHQLMDLTREKSSEDNIESAPLISKDNSNHYESAIRSLRKDKIEEIIELEEFNFDFDENKESTIKMPPTQTSRDYEEPEEKIESMVSSPFMQTTVEKKDDTIIQSDDLLGSNSHEGENFEHMIVRERKAEGRKDRFPEFLPDLPRKNRIADKRNVEFNLSERASVTPIVICKMDYKIKTDLLDRGEEAYAYSDPTETKKIISILESTLQQFNVEGKVVGIQRGPIITRFELKIAPGIKVNRILSLTDELAMALEALRVRIEAPIPGRSTVGIEIPNKKRIKVLLGDILRADSFQEFEGKLPLPIGKDIAGNLVIADLTKLPHLLIAGATGAGKSVSVNSFIVSFIINKSPKEIRFLMIDPKLVELSQYNDIPHLLHPVITDPQKSVAALNWSVEEMERRYEDLAEARVRDISGYNKRIQESTSSKEDIAKLYMPYIVILVDELGDLMMVAGKEVEFSIIRLSQKARAVGIHLILATQRPSVDVITALIKANCPARIALQVAQKTDSRTILDGNGAEQLLGQGDSLFKHPTQGQLMRVQAPLVKDTEVEDIVEVASMFAKPNYIILDDGKTRTAKLDTEDEELFEEAWEIILESRKASASYLQRRLRIGYNKAARLIEAFEARGYIGPQIGSKPRDILMPE